MLSHSDCAEHIAALAPVPMEHLDDGKNTAIAPWVSHVVLGRVHPENLNGGD